MIHSIEMHGLKFLNFNQMYFGKYIITVPVDYEKYMKIIHE